MALGSQEPAGDRPAADARARRRMLLVVNPYATGVSPRLRGIVLDALAARHDVEVVDTCGPGHATELAREAAREGLDAVVTFGGDGTVNEAANGLAGSDTPLAPLPGGAQNVYVKMLGIPADVPQATEHLLCVAGDKRPRRVDLGRVNGRCFVFSSGLGLDAAVVRRVDAHPAAKAGLRHWYYAAAGLRTFATDYVVRPPRLDVDLEGRTVQGVTALVQTGDPYTYWGARPLHVAEGIALDDGTLAGVVLERIWPADVPGILVRLFARRLRVVRHRRVFGFNDRRQVVCTSADGRPVPLQVDGDHVGDVVEARYDVVPGGLAVVA